MRDDRDGLPGLADLDDGTRETHDNPASTRRPRTGAVPHREFRPGHDLRRPFDARSDNALLLGRSFRLNR